MTLLTIAQTAASRIGIPVPETVINNTNTNVKFLLAKILEAGRDIATMRDWPELQREHTFTLVTDQANYALPGDMNFVLTMTHWDRNSHWPLIGPLSPQEWQYRKSGISSSVPRDMFRVKGFTDRQLYLHPTPGSGDSGATMVFEYCSKNWCRPKTWVASTNWNQKSYSFYNGNFYTRNATTNVSTGTTAPTHITGSTSDGSITWEYYDDPYETFYSDEDETILDAENIIAGAVWRFKRDRGWNYLDLKESAEEALKWSGSDLNGGTIVDFSGNAYRGLGLGFGSIPDGDFPTS